MRSQRASTPISGELEFCVHNRQTEWLVRFCLTQQSVAILVRNSRNEWFWSQSFHWSPRCLVPSLVARWIYHGGFAAGIAMCHGWLTVWVCVDCLIQQALRIFFFSTLFTVLCHPPSWNICTSEKLSHLEKLRSETFFSRQSSPSVGPGGNLSCLSALTASQRRFLPRLILHWCYTVCCNDVTLNGSIPCNIKLTTREYDRMINN